VLVAFGPSGLPGLFPRVEDESEFRKLFRWLPLKLELCAPLAEFGALRRTMRFRGAGLLSRLPTGEGCFDDWLLPQREWRVTRVLLSEESTSFGTGAAEVGRELEPLLAAVRERGLPVGDCGREEAALVGSLVRFQEDSWSPVVGRTGAGIEVRREVLAALLGDSESETRPPPRSALVIALSFIGLSTSSSELSAIVGCDEGWPRCAIRAEVRLPMGGYRLPASSGVRDISRV